MQDRVHERVRAIEALPEEDRRRLQELVHRSNLFNDCLVDVENALGPSDHERRQEQFELLRAERDAAWGEARSLEISLGLPELW